MLQFGFAIIEGQLLGLRISYTRCLLGTEIESEIGFGD